MLAHSESLAEPLMSMEPSDHVAVGGDRQMSWMRVNNPSEQRQDQSCGDDDERAQLQAELQADEGADQAQLQAAGEAHGEHEEPKRPL